MIHEDTLNQYIVVQDMPVSEISKLTSIIEDTFSRVLNDPSVVGSSDSFVQESNGVTKYIFCIDVRTSTPEIQATVYLMPDIEVNKDFETVVDNVFETLIVQITQQLSTCALDILKAKIDEGLPF